MKMLVLVITLLVTVVPGGVYSNWDSLDPSVESIWHTAATNFTRFMCDSESVVSCLVKLPSCRPLLYYSYPFTHLTYGLFSRYLQTCSDQTGSGLNLQAFPDALAQWQTEKLDGIQMIYDLGLTEDNLHNMFYCLQLKFNNMNAFKECINT